MHTIHLLQPAILPAVDVFQWSNNFLTNFLTTLRAAALVAAVLLIVVTAIKTGLRIPAMVIACCGAALLLWAVTLDGLGIFSKVISDTANNQSAGAGIGIVQEL